MSKEEIKEKIRKAVEETDMKNDISKLSLFGSYLAGAEKGDSDVDLLVEFYPNRRVGLFRLVEIQRRLGEKIGKEVDLLTPEGLSKFFRDEVLKEAETIYEKQQVLHRAHP